MISNRKIGGIRFVKIGRLSMSFCVSKPRPQSSRYDRQDAAEVASLATVAVMVAAPFLALILS